jgi:hypothetical protein
MAHTATAARRRKPTPQAFLAIAVRGVTSSFAGYFDWIVKAEIAYTPTLVSRVP